MIITKNLRPHDHTNEKVHEMLGLMIANMERAFMYVDEDQLKKINAEIIRLTQ